MLECRFAEEDLRVPMDAKWNMPACCEHEHELYDKANNILVCIKES